METLQTDTVPTDNNDRSAEAGSTPRLAPIEEPNSWWVWLAYKIAEWTEGTIITPLKVVQARLPESLRLAYGMLGQISRAEDVVQDAYLRWREVDADEVDAPEAYLSTIVTRLCLDELTSARAEREQYPGPWLPEPVVAPEDRPDADVEREHDLSLALLVLLEQLRPIERAVYVLREAFDRPYAEIARRVDRTEAHCRKIAQRARGRRRA
ncbi:MAG: sigma factor [Salinibacter sp.]